MTKLAPNLTPREAAELLTEAGIPITDEAVRNWLKAGRLASILLPSGRRLIPRTAVEAIINGPRAEPAVSAA